MKSSHFSAPRQLSDSVFIASGDPIERPTECASAWTRWISPLLVVVGVVALLTLAAAVARDL